MCELDGQTPLQLGVTKWRTLVTYVPQTRVHPKGTPSEFYFTVQVHAGPERMTAPKHSALLPLGPSPFLITFAACAHASPEAACLLSSAALCRPSTASPFLHCRAAIQGSEGASAR